MDTHFNPVYSIRAPRRRETDHAKIIRSPIVSGSKPDSARRIVALSAVVGNRDGAWVVIDRRRPAHWFQPVIVNRAVGIFIKTMACEERERTVQRRFPSIAPDTRRIIVGGIIGNDIVVGERVDH